MNKQRWILGAAVVFVVAAAGCDAQFSVADGPQTLHVYTVDDSISTTVAPADRPGMVGRLIGMCDADTYYVTYGDNAECVVLNGSLGDVQVADGLTIRPSDAARIADLVGRDDQAQGGAASTRVVLEDNAGPVAIVSMSDLRTGRAVTATKLD